MSSNPIEPRSIASQLVLLFTLAAAILLCCGLGVFYILVVRHAFQEDNQFLADKVFVLRGELKAADWPATLIGELKTPHPGEPGAYWVRIIDSAGRIVVETPHMGEVLPPEIFPENKPVSAILRSKSYRTNKKLFSLVATTERANGQTYTLQLAQDRSTDDQFSRNFGALLILGLVLGIVASTIIAVTVTRRGLRPLVKMTETLKRVGPTRLDERLAPVGWPKELQPLAVAFDRMLEGLDDSFKRLSQFSADLAHELRTPVANMIGEAQVALTRTREPDEYREVIASGVAECERLSQVIDNLLFLARAEAPDEQTQRRVFDGKAAIAQIAALFEPVAEEQNVTITCTGEGDVFADRMLFDRAVSNLVENALRYTLAGGAILISIAIEDSQSKIAVRDTGCGIAPEHIPRVFDRFYRADSSRSSQGTGLGLALVKSITKLHGGTVSLESEVGRGTTVNLIFPRRGPLEQFA